MRIPRSIFSTRATARSRKGEFGSHGLGRGAQGRQCPGPEPFQGLFGRGVAVSTEPSDEAGRVAGTFRDLDECREQDEAGCPEHRHSFASG